MYLVTVHYVDGDYHYLFQNRENAIKLIENDLKDLNHFDDDEPDITKEEMDNLIKEMRESIDDCDFFDYDDENQYNLEEIEFDDKEYEK